MEKEVKIRQHKILDHPILGYFLLVMFSMIITQIVAGIIDSKILANIIPGYRMEITFMGKTSDATTGVGAALGAVLSAFIFWLWFQRKFEGVLTFKNVKKGLTLVAPLVILHVIGSLVSIVTVGITDSVIVAFLHATAPGFSEEIGFRGLGVANYMRTIKESKKIPVIFWISSVVFGFAHMANAIVGSTPTLALIQSVYAVGIGMAFAGVYLRTGSMWPTIIGHMIIDFAELSRADLASSNALMTGLTVGDYITIIVGILGAVWGLYLIRKSVRDDIMEVWNRKWNALP